MLHGEAGNEKDYSGTYQEEVPIFDAREFCIPSKILWGSDPQLIF
jgi:hypothetical protein